MSGPHRGVMAAQFDEGLEKGREEGIKEGIKKEKRHTAKTMFLKGIAVETISEITGLSKEEIGKLFT